MLALDGGGIRGVLTLEIVLELERQLREATGAGDAFRLGDWFDYIAGTSTGAIIAAGLARGMSARGLLDFYVSTGPQMFEKRFLLNRLKSFYKADPLEKKLREVYGQDTDLSPEGLRCLLLVVTRNVTTDSPWPISSNPLARYNDPTRKDCNLRIPLWQLVRASTAAPIFFPPEVLQWDKDDPAKTFVFVDGGVTPYNNPAFLLFRMATMPGYRLEWKTGERNLLLVSIGTGAAPDVDADIASPEKALPGQLAGLPGTFMYGMLVDQDINCRAIGRCVHGDPIDREIGDAIPRDAGGNPIPLSADLGRAFLYARYNADISAAGLAAMSLAEIDPGKVAKMDAVDQIDNLRAIGRKAAKQVRIADFGGFVA
ncbi:MAG: patatin-like phospholipase family protein [Gemmatimonadetes bacterium]|nr:patatin-like phospholipase family protein [Gemmatimonadota bacterium]